MVITAMNCYDEIFFRIPQKLRSVVYSLGDFLNEIRR
jgi:hypothetical protein